MADNTDIVQQIRDHLQSLKQPDYGTAGGALGALINGNRVSDAYGASAADAGSQADTLRTQMEQMPTLAAMYGPDSPYAQQLQQTLARKDAAAGRNSQYGPRAVQLQAMLADKGSQYAQQQAAMAQAYNTARSNANQQRINAVTGQAQVQGQQLGSLFNLGEKSGLLPAINTGLSNMAQPYIQKANTALGDMFPSWNGSSQAPTQQQVDQYSQGGPSTGVYGLDNQNTYTPSANDYAQGGPSSGVYGTGGYQTTGAPTDSSNMYYQPYLDEEVPQ